jgi:hypothetical protein
LRIFPGLHILLRATLIAMGITGKSAVKQAMFGSNTLKLVDKNLYPVMIIPPDAVYNGINNIAFASDFNNIEATTLFYPYQFSFGDV